MGSLRSRLILSHILPLALTVPLIGLALVYLLETQVLLTSLSAELQKNAVVIAEISSPQIQVWQDPASAQTFIAQVSPRLNAKVMLLDQDGHLLASSELAEETMQGQRMNFPDLDRVLTGETSVQLTYGRTLFAEIADVMVPVTDSQGKVLGVIRLTDQLSGLQSRFGQLRGLIAWVLGGGLVFGIVLGWYLAVNLERPILRTTGAVEGLASGRILEPLPEEGSREIRQLLRAVNTLVERLQTSEENRRRLLANLVHELGRPLGALRSAVQALEGGADVDVDLRGELLRGMEGELIVLNRLLDDLAGLHDQVVGSMELNIQPLQPGSWLAEVISPWREAALEKNLRWETDIPAELPLLKMDPERMNQAVGNLLSNAISYTPAGGEVSVSAGLDPAGVWIAVRDTGPGLSSEEQARIFTAFYRGVKNRRFPQGMGLGLTIAREIISAHKGLLVVESRPGEGSVFTIRLPLNLAG